MNDAGEGFSWLTLSMYTQQEDILLRDTGITTPRGAVLLGLDRQERRHLLVPVADDFAIDPFTGEALRLGEWTNTERADLPRRFLDLCCTSGRLGEVFASLVDDVLARITLAPNEAPTAIHAGLDDWQRLLNASTALGSEQARGLFGELLVLRELARTNAPHAVQCWTGPDSAAHDFTTPRGDIEVKTSSADGLDVTVSSLIQLDHIGPAPLVLVRVAVQASPQGESIDELVADLETMGCPPGALHQRLSMVGHTPHLPEAERFVLVGPLRGWLVGDDFPGLRRSEIPETRRDAISRVSYTISLAGAPGALSEAELTSWFSSVVSA